MVSDALHHLYHLHKLPRVLPSRLPINTIGRIPDKRTWMNSQFSCFAFSFILRGNGHFHDPVTNTVLPVVAPCVLTQRYGEHFNYGPTTSWHEVYAVYDKNEGPALRDMGFIRDSCPLWSIGDLAPIRRAFALIDDLMRIIERPGTVDRIDHCMHGAIQESLLESHLPHPTPRQSAIAKAREILEARCTAPPESLALARELQLTPGTFRRWWRESMDVPPARYAMQVRMRQACRMLVESHRSISAIAEHLGFFDPLHFSRCFHRTIGMPATRYRAMNAPWGLGSHS